MSRALQVPDAVGVADVTRVDRVLEIDEERVLETDEERIVDTEEEVPALVDELVDTLVDEVLPVPPPHPNWMLLNCHVTVVLENPDHTNATTALAFAPEKEDRGMVTVCEAPVKPLTVV
jgi:hypothetical protein